MITSDDVTKIERDRNINTYNLITAKFIYARIQKNVVAI